MVLMSVVVAPQTGRLDIKDGRVNHVSFVFSFNAALLYLCSVVRISLWCYPNMLHDALAQAQCGGL